MNTPCHSFSVPCSIGVGECKGGGRGREGQTRWVGGSIAGVGLELLRELLLQIEKDPTTLHVSMSAAKESGTRGTGQGPRSIANSATGAYATHSQTLQPLVTLLEAQQRFDVQQRYN